MGKTEVFIMTYRMQHFNFNVQDLSRSIKFYADALDFHPVKEKSAPDGAYKLVFLGDGVSNFQLELSWLRDHPQPYDLGEGEIHLAVRVADYAAARARHEELGCVCFVNEAMGIYFISDPDGYWIEILPEE